jgi:c(7)-type cytochrome triheme protein
MKHLMIMVCMILLISGSTYAVGSGSSIVYEGKSAGAVVFDGTVHANGLTCANCHESIGLTPPLFEMKRGESWITMKKMERGRSCGYCHEVQLHDFSSCGKCHHKG